MKKLYLDANIIIDLVSGRPGLNKELINSLVETPGEYLYISVLSVHITYYILKIKPNSQLEKNLKKLLGKMNVLPLTEAIIRSATNIDFYDFEDLLQYLTAREYCDIILTSDLKDFRKIKQLVPSDLQIDNKL